MRIFRNIFVLVLLITISSCDKDDDFTGEVPESPSAELKVIGKGTILAQPKSILDPRSGENATANCFFMELIDAETGEVIGSLDDCGLSMTPNDDGTQLAEQLAVFSITGKGTFISENFVLLTPKEGAVFSTQFQPQANNILTGTGDFEGAEGTVSLDGEADLTLLDSGIVTFNCTFTVEIDQ